MYIIICLIAAGASFLSLFSGFGLGTLLMPAFALFFPVEVSVAMTAVVHMLNNVFKLAMFGRHADRNVVIKFAQFGVIAAVIGATLLGMISKISFSAQYELFGKTMTVAPVKIVAGVLMIAFSLFELIPRFENMKFDKKWIPLGGALSGFFGGLTGFQGALRSAFLSRAGLEKEVYIGTGVVIAFMIDITRISVYSGYFAIMGMGENWKLILAVVLSAFLGAFIGARLLKKVTVKAIHILVGVMLILLGISLIAGII